MILTLVSIVGAGLFLWPFFGGGTDATPGISLALAALLAVGAVEVGARRLDSRGVALLAAIAALNAAARMALVTGLEGFSPMFFLVLCAGFGLGPGFGFTAGATSLLVSALATGGIGPWLPYEMFAAGWIGAFAGVFHGFLTPAPRRRQILLLAILGVAGGFLYGALMDTWDWATFYRGVPEFGWSPGLAPALALARFWRFYLATSFIYDSFRAGGNALMVVLLGAPVLTAMARLRARLAFVVVSG